jgi:hypothetical protein
MSKESIEKRARELLAGMARQFGQPEYGHHIGCGGDLDQEDKSLIAPIIAALTPPDGWVLVPAVLPEPMLDVLWRAEGDMKDADMQSLWAELIAARPEVA